MLAILTTLLFLLLIGSQAPPSTSAFQLTWPSPLVPMPMTPEMPVSLLPPTPITAAQPSTPACRHLECVFPFLLADSTRSKRLASVSIDENSIDGSTSDLLEKSPIEMIARANEPIAASTTDCALILKRTFVQRRRQSSDSSSSPLNRYDLLSGG